MKGAAWVRLDTFRWEESNTERNWLPLMEGGCSPSSAPTLLLLLLLLLLLPLGLFPLLVLLGLCTTGDCSRLASAVTSDLHTIINKQV